MSKSQGRIIEGVFAINKPASISSAQVIRNLQRIFNPSALFAPWLELERVARSNETHFERKRRKDNRVQVKIGHGGTLDPMATGVLIMGVGKGTKQLQGFLDSTKSYEATVLFGWATDTYDTHGKILRKATYDHVSRTTVEEALQRFRGKIMQRPPIYSALRMDGKRLYEYAREGKEVPREIEERPVEVKELEIIEWLDGGTHEQKLPNEDAEPEEKEVAEKVLHFSPSTTDPVADGNTSPPNAQEASMVLSAKRKRSPHDRDNRATANKKQPSAQSDKDTAAPTFESVENSEQYSPSASHTPGLDCKRSEHRTQDTGPPAIKLRMTVTSGFYVRSLAHDIGEAVGSLACMSALVRTRQGNYELGRNVLEYKDVEKGEDVWGPKVEALISDQGKGKAHMADDDGNLER